MHVPWYARSMLFSKKENLKDHIVSLLQYGPKEATGLIEAMKKTRPGTTKQGVYDALRVLQAQEVVVKSKKTVSLSAPWLTKAERFVAQSLKKTVHDSSGSWPISHLADGESMRYSFKTFWQMNHYDNHVAVALLQLLPPDVPAFYYNQREIFIYKTKEGEDELVLDFTKDQRQVCILFGNTSEFDKQVMREHDSPLLQYHFLKKPLIANQQQYFGILGDFVTEYRLDLGLVRAIDRFYKTHNEYNASAVRDLQKIMHLPGRHRFKISRNEKRAKMLRKKIEKYFYFPKS